ncbi:hypothetical protein J2X24_002959 [Asticcacaulis solisilvae]|nr:hypothetical protein [Asticcacaulis solisilvae]MDR6801313.1 hypothetical protein [Asticcacaulis sp. BE141]
MPWNEVSIMDRRQEFLSFASQADANIASLCRSFGISRKTGYKVRPTGMNTYDICFGAKRIATIDLTQT